MSPDLHGLPLALVYPISFVFGAIWGSFLNVCIARLPTEESVVRPRSRCPSCKTPIRAVDNIPIISYLLLRGRCRSCGMGISPRYPVVELLAGMCCVVLIHRFGLSWSALAYFILVAGLLIATFVDLAHMIIPNEVTYLLLPVGIGLSFIPGATVPPLHALIGAAAGGGILFAVAMGYRLWRGFDGLGFGDVKLLAVIGAFLGWKALPLVLFLAAVQGLLAAGVVALSRIGKPSREEEGEATPAAGVEDSHRATDRPTPGPGSTAAAESESEKSGESSIERDLAEEDDEPGPPPGRMAIPFGPFLSLAAIEALFFGSLLSRYVFGFSL